MLANGTRRDQPVQRFASSIPILFFTVIMLIGLLISACGGTPSTTSRASSSPAAIHSSTAAPLSTRSMRVDVGGYQLYIRCMGQGSPTVVLDAGLGGDVNTWDRVQPEVAQFTQACAYDRANVAPSDNRPTTIKVSAQQIARELHTLLVNANLPGPYVLVGHSLGGLFMQMYACHYPHEVAGMVLVDSVHPEQQAHLAAVLGPEFTKEARQGFPVEGITYDDVLAMQAQVDAVSSQFPNVPLIVLARSHFQSSPTWTADQLKQAWMSLQTDLSRRSSRGKLVIAQNSSHDIPNDRPDLVASSIHEVVLETRHPSS
jgi:pimeloyl-ACP methyl ester carboxylesterase